MTDSGSAENTNEEIDLLLAAQEVRPFLSRLLGAQAQAVDVALASILLSSESLEQKLEHVRNAFAADERLNDWVGQFLAGGSIPPEVVAGTSRAPDAVPVGLPGDVTIRPGVRFACPNGDYTRYLLRRGEVVERCPTCGLELVRVP